MNKKIFLFAISASLALAADNQKDLNLINAGAAHDNGITGEGIKIGVIDGAARLDHPSLVGQILSHKYSFYNGMSKSITFGTFCLAL